MQQITSLRLFLDNGNVLEWRLLDLVAGMLSNVRIRGHEARLTLEGDNPDDYLIELDTTDWDLELGDIQDVGACPAFPSRRVALEATNALRDVLVDRFPGVPLKVKPLFHEETTTDPDAVGVTRYEVLSAPDTREIRGLKKRVQQTNVLPAHSPKQRHFRPSQKITARYSGRCSECREPFQARSEIYHSHPEGACCLACGVADLKELTDEEYKKQEREADEEYERQARERWEAWHEESYTTAYCPDCDMTYEFHSIAELGGRSSVPIKCPNCQKELGGRIEDDATLKWQRKGKE